MEKQKIIPVTETSKKEENLPSNLNAAYMFDNFMESSSNSYAYKLAKRVICELGARENNPLMLCGAAGTGKTHLLHAIGNQILKDNSEVKVLYITGKSFFEEFVATLQNKKMETLRERFSELDCFLIDDIQFLAGKSCTQFELFVIIRDLLQRGKQIVLSSDSLPLQLGFRENLTRLIKSGLIAEIKG